MNPYRMQSHLSSFITTKKLAISRPTYINRLIRA